MKKIIAVILLSTAVFELQAQNIDSVINVNEVNRVEKILSSDSLRGRKVFTADIEKASAFIENEFKEAGLTFFKDNKDFRQSFTLADLNDNDITNANMNGKLNNIVGILPGKSKPDEYVVFSAHYDHLGVGEAVDGDSIYNGANDDASGVTAVILLAKYFKALNNNQRTLIFAAFTAEEIGEHGSSYFSGQLDPLKVKAMFNIEMIGTESKWGKNSAYITGYEKTSLGKILNKNVAGTGFKFHADPYPAEKLFYRSDNATLAALGVPAHTVSTSKMDDEPHYHKPGDELGTLDMPNMAQVIKAIALSSKTIVSGAATPSRVSVKDIK